MEVSSIGAWEGVFDRILKLAVLSNMGIVCFTSRVLVHWSVQGRLACSVSYTHLTLPTKRIV